MVDRIICLFWRMWLGEREVVSLSAFPDDCVSISNMFARVFK